MERKTHGLRAVALTLLALAGVVLAAGTAPAADDSGISGVVNVNTASAEELQLLPGIGEARARAVIEARKRRGGFKAVDELVEVKGIGEAALKRMRPHVAVSGKTTAQPK